MTPEPYPALDALDAAILRYLRATNNTTTIGAIVKATENNFRAVEYALGGLRQAGLVKQDGDLPPYQLTRRGEDHADTLEPWLGEDD